MNSGQEVSGKFVVTSSDPTKILEPAEAALNDVAALVGPFVEAMEGNAVGSVRNDRLCAAIDDFGTQSVTVISFIADECGHGRRKRQDLGCGRDVVLLTGCEMKGYRPAKWVAQGMDFGCATAA